LSSSYEVTRKDRLFKNIQRMQQLKVCTQHIMTSAVLSWRAKNSHVLSKYSEFVFFQLHLVKILCKLIIIW